LRYVAHQHCLGCLRGWDRLAGGLGDTRFPLLIRVAELVEQPDWVRIPLVTHLLRSPALGACPDEEATARMLTDQLAAGGCLILVDGLDEVPSAPDRERVVTKIQQFTDDYVNVHSGNSIVVTSRVAGYRAAPLTSRYRHFRLAELAEREIVQFARKWAE